MADTSKQREPSHVEDIDPAPLLGKVGEGATQQSGEYISRELRELTERARAHRREEQRKAQSERHQS